MFANQLACESNLVGHCLGAKGQPAELGYRLGAIGPFDCLLCAAQFAHVPDVRAGELESVKFQWAQTDFNRNLGPVCVKRAQRGVDSHWPGHRVSGVRASVLAVCGTKPRRHQLVDGHPVQLLDWIAEHLRALGVGKHNPARCIDHQHGIGGGSKNLHEKPGQACLAHLGDRLPLQARPRTHSWVTFGANR